MAKPRSRILKYILTIIGGIALALIGWWAVASLFLILFLHINTREQPLKLSEVIRYSHVDFPPSARLEGAVLQPNIMDYTVYAKIILDRKDLGGFLENGFSRVTKAKPAFSRDFVMFKDVYNWEDMKPSNKKARKWWTPRSAQHGLGAHIPVLRPEDPEGFTDDWIEVVIDERGGEQVAVYLFAAYW